MFTRRTFIKSVCLVSGFSGLIPTAIWAQDTPPQTTFTAEKSKECFTSIDLPDSIAAIYDDVVRRIHLEIWQLENSFHTGDTIGSISGRLDSITNKALRFSNSDDHRAKQLFQAESLIAWIRTNVDYWTEMNNLPAKERSSWNIPEKVLSHSPRPKGNCDGFSRLTTVLGRRMGLTIYGVGGTLRPSRGKIEIGPDTDYLQGLPWNHGWNLFQIGEKYFPADTSNSWKFRDDEFKQGWRGKTDASNALPLTEDEWDVFLGHHRLLQIEGKPTNDPLTSMSVDTWVKTSPAYLESKITELRLNDTQRNYELEHRENAE